MEFDAHNAKMELIRSYNDGLITTEEMSNAWDMIDNAEQDLANDRIDAGAAEYEFRLFCEEGPGARATDVLAAMKVEFENTKRYWKRALACARLARAAWLAA